MNELLNKLTSYNLFNYLLPGAIFVVIAEKTSSFSFIQENIFLAFFLYYFIGMIISRIGSLIIEPLLTKLKIIKYSPYSQFLAASKKDSKIDILLEANNTYRTICSLFLLLIVLKSYEFLLIKFPELNKWNSVLLLFGLLILFVLSFRKQTRYITKRIDHNIKNE